MERLTEYLKKLLLGRSSRLDRFDTTYIDDFHLIMKENYNIIDYKDREKNSDFDNMCQTLINDFNEDINENTRMEEITDILKKHISDPRMFMPKHTPVDKHTTYHYTTITDWDNIKDRKDIQTINEIQKKYSLRQGASGDGGKGCFSIRFNNEKENLFRNLNPNSHVLSIGCRWVDEIKYIRKTFNIPNTFGLDLFSKDENYVKMGDIHKAPFPDNSFDVVYQKNTFNKLYDLRKALDECVRILKPGGLLISDDCLDYTIGVNPVARSNVTSNSWFIAYLKDHIGEVILDVERAATPFADRAWRKKEGLLAIKIKK